MITSLRKHRLDAAVVLVGVLILIWPFMVHPGKIFYNRFFEGWSIFNPAWINFQYIQGWTYAFHLGSQQAPEIAYVSVFTLLMQLFSVFGTAFVSKSYPAVMQALTFASMYLLLRTKFSRTACTPAFIGALFFSSNGLVAGIVHDGYSGMLPTYFGLPLMILAFDWLVSRGNAAAVGVFPLYFTITGFYRFPAIVGDGVSLIVLRWRELRSKVFSTWRFWAIVVAAFGVNAYWALPVIADLKLAPYIPVVQDTRAEIGIIDNYASLSNVALLKVFGAFGTDNSICATCGYYDGAEYLLGALAILVVTVVVLWHRKMWTLLGLLMASVFLSTGYRYQDELIGVPYQILMGLPIPPIFRDPYKFAFMIAFVCSIGVCIAAGGRDRSAAIKSFALLLAVATAGWPLISGGLYEKTPAAPAGAFFISLPKAYAEARKRLDETTPPLAAVLLLPESGLADYEWGGRDADFLFTWFSRPTISRLNNWTEPSPGVEAGLTAINNPASRRAQLAGILSDLRIGTVFVHDDVIGFAPVPRSRFGVSYATFGAKYALIRPYLPPIPMIEASRDAGTVRQQDVTLGYRPFLGELTRAITSKASDGECGIRGRSLTPTRFRRGVQQTLGAIADCAKPMRLDVVLSSGSAGAFLIRNGHALVPVSARVVNRRAFADVWRAIVAPHVFGKLVFRSSGARGYALFLRVADRAVSVPHPLSPKWHGGWLWTSFDSGRDRFVALNQSFSKSWVALAPNESGWFHALPHFEANGYSNGWSVPVRSKIVLLNIAQLSMLAGALVGFICLALMLVLLFLSRRATVTHDAERA